MYNPKIEPLQIKGLYMLKKRTGKAMMKLVREALDLYFQEEAIDLESAQHFCLMERKKAQEIIDRKNQELRDELNKMAKGELE